MSADHALPHGLARRWPWWPLAKRVLTALFFLLVLALLITQARSIEWGEVMGALGRYETATLLAAAALAALSFAVYSSFDLIGRRYSGHALSTRQVVTVSFVSYAFNLNLGSLIGGVAFRYRLYAKLGLGNDVITRVLGLSMLTNWLGYMVVAGAVLLFHPIVLPEDWKLDTSALPWVGGVLLAVAAAYLLTCALSPRRHWTLRSHEIDLPSGRMALLQMGVSSVNWLLIASVVFTVLQQRVDYPTVLGVLLVAAVAGVIAHVPAGIGVLETVFVTLLSPGIPTHELLAALLAYRAVYYLLPLLVAAGLLARIEWRGRRAAAQGALRPARCWRG